MWWPFLVNNRMIATFHFFLHVPASQPGLLLPHTFSCQREIKKSTENLLLIWKMLFVQICLMLPDIDLSTILSKLPTLGKCYITVQTWGSYFVSSIFFVFLFSTYIKYWLDSFVSIAVANYRRFFFPSNSLRSRVFTWHFKNISVWTTICC